MLIKTDPVAKPRMTQRDKWMKRPCVLRYRAYRDELRLRIPNDVDLNGAALCFGIPMPKSWSKKKRKEMCGRPHQQKPDLDNLLKGLLDALYINDETVHRLSDLRKVWANEGFVRIHQL